MASITQRGSKWRAQIRKNGRSLSETFNSQAEAVDWAFVSFIEEGVVRDLSFFLQRQTYNNIWLSVVELFVGHICATFEQRWSTKEQHSKKTKETTPAILSETSSPRFELICRKRLELREHPRRPFAAG